MFTMVLGVLIGITLILFALARHLGSAQSEWLANDPLVQQFVNERIAPVGEVITDPEAVLPPSVPEPGQTAPTQLAGDAVYNQACVGCHVAGALGAPVTGDAAQWAARLPQGLDVLYQHAIEGIGVMPPKGGFATLSDGEVRAAVDYMLAQLPDSQPDAAPAEADPEPSPAEEPAAPEAQPEQAETAPEPDATEEPVSPEAQSEQTQAVPAEEPEAAAPSEAEWLATGEYVYEMSCVACHEGGWAGAPALELEYWEHRLPQGLETLYRHAIDGIGEMPPKGGGLNERGEEFTDEEVHAAVDYMLSRMSIDPSALETPEFTDVGEQIFVQSCSVCHHADSVIGAPRLGNAGDWLERVARGTETLYQNALQGVFGPAGFMPPRGGNPNLSDDEVRAAVDYILEQLPAAEAPEVEEQTEEPQVEEPVAEPQAEEPAAEPQAEEPAADVQEEEETGATAQAQIAGAPIYDVSCSFCHDFGTAGAPPMDDLSMWEDRLAQGQETLYRHAIEGFGGMPPRGGNPNLSDDEVRAAVDHMLELLELL